MHRSIAVTDMLFAMTVNLAASFIGLAGRCCGGEWPALCRGITIRTGTGFDPGEISMHEIGPFIGALRRRVRFLVPRRWLTSYPKPRLGLRARRPSRARFEVDAASPATSWVAWEISRRGRPEGTELSRRESEQ